MQVTGIIKEAARPWDQTNEPKKLGIPTKAIEVQDTDNPAPTLTAITRSRDKRAGIVALYTPAKGATIGAMEKKEQYDPITKLTFKKEASLSTLVYRRVLYTNTEE